MLQTKRKKLTCTLVSQYANSFHVFFRINRYLSHARFIVLLPWQRANYSNFHCLISMRWIALETYVSRCERASSRAIQSRGATFAPLFPSLFSFLWQKTADPWRTWPNLPSSVRACRGNNSFMSSTHVSAWERGKRERERERDRAVVEISQRVISLPKLSS